VSSILSRISAKNHRRSFAKSSDYGSELVQVEDLALVHNHHSIGESPPLNVAQRNDAQRVFADANRLGDLLGVRNVGGHLFVRFAGDEPQRTATHLDRGPNEKDSFGPLPANRPSGVFEGKMRLARTRRAD
jgi:hypothetical protein